MPLLKTYMRDLLSTLDFIHSKGIIHRDIKPHNVLFDPSTKALKIIDFGLAEFYNWEMAMSPKVASRYFKAPELLMETPYYNYSIDVWAVGIIFASIVP
jgi:casein kinase II subunit alpha